MSDQVDKIPYRDETPQGSNSAKTADAATTAKQANEVSVAEEPSGYRGENPSTSGPGGTGIRSSTPENAAGHTNPSAPGDTGTTPGTTPRE